MPHRLALAPHFALFMPVCSNSSRICTSTYTLRTTSCFRALLLGRLPQLSASQVKSKGDHLMSHTSDRSFIYRNTLSIPERMVERLSLTARVDFESLLRASSYLSNVGHFHG